MFVLSGALLLSPGGAAGSERVAYVALPVDFGFYCEKDAPTLLNPPWTPQPDPYEDPLGWFLSFQHECTANSARNVVGDHRGEPPDGLGVGVYGFRYAVEDALAPASAVAVDQVDMPTHIQMEAVSQSTGKHSAEGCGLQAMSLPADPEPSHALTVWVRSVVVAEDLDVCLGTTGRLHGAWGSTG